MNSALLYSLAGLGLAIIIALAVVAWRLQRQVRDQQREHQARLEDQKKRDAERTAFVLDSLRILSTNVIEEDLNLSEATIRCKILIDALELPASEREPYQVLDTVFDKVQYFDTHGARQALSRDERDRQDEEREAIEAEYAGDLKACFSRLRYIGLTTQ